MIISTRLFYLRIIMFPSPNAETWTAVRDQSFSRTVFNQTSKLEMNDINEGLKTETDREQPKNRENPDLFEEVVNLTKCSISKSNLLTNSILMYNGNQEKTHYNKSSTKFRDSRLTVYIFSLKMTRIIISLFPLLISSIMRDRFFFFLEKLYQLYICVNNSIL